MFFHLFTRCSDCIQRGQIIGTHLAGAPMTKTDTLLGVLKVTVARNHNITTAAQVTAETNIHLADPVPTKTVLN